MADPDEDNEASESEKEKAEKRDDKQSDSSDRSEQNPTTRDQKNVTKVQFAQNQVHNDEFNHETNQLHNNKNTKKTRLKQFHVQSEFKTSSNSFGKLIFFWCRCFFHYVRIVITFVNVNSCKHCC